MIVFSTAENYKYPETSGASPLKRKRLSREHIRFLQNLGFTVNHEYNQAAAVHHVPNLKRLKKFNV